MSLSDLGTFAAALFRARRWRRSQDRAAIESEQHRLLRHHLHRVARHSPFYRAFAGQPLEAWPIIDKSVWMDQFDAINTVGASLSELSDLAVGAEKRRDFESRWRGHTVGLSTGTSGRRGLFLVSDAERARWAGTLIARLPPRHLLKSERIAMILRAGGPLYERIGALRLRFQFFDQLQPWQSLVDQIDRFRPTILVAPARTLAALAREPLHSRPWRVVSVAEVLDPLDRQRIEQAFGGQVQQIYQATEGLLGVTCEHGTMHLSEPDVIIEKQWLDSAQTLFVPVITDLHRVSQPVIRYRLNDVLRVRGAPCACGSAALALDAIEGRLDDVLHLPGIRGPVAVYPDLLTRAVVLAAPDVEDFRISETAPGRWRIGLRPPLHDETRRAIAGRMRVLAETLGATPPVLEFGEIAPEPAGAKQRRVRGAGGMACAS